MISAAAMTFPAGAGARVAVNAHDAQALMALIEARIAAGRSFSVATLNLDHLVKLRRDPAFRAAYLDTDFVVADGNPIVWLARLARRPVALAPGSELIDPICALAARHGWPVALFGSSERALADAAVRLAAATPGLKIAAAVAPPFGFDPASAAATVFADRIAASGARICLVALGAPKQEIFARLARDAVSGCGFVSIGAGLDFIAGTQKRAPRWMRRLALEWLWRALGNPRRLGRRYLSCGLALPGLARDALRLRAVDAQ